MFGKKKKTEQQQKPVKLTRKGAQESRQSTKPKAVEKQINLKALKGEEQETWIKRLAWLYAHGSINEDTIKEIIEKNRKGTIVNVMMDEMLFIEDAELILVFTGDWMSENPEFYYPDEYVELSAKKRSDNSYPVVQFIIESMDIEVMLEGIADDEDGDRAMNFAKAFWMLADEFTSYKLSTGKQAFTMDYEEYLPKNNKMREIRLGYGEEGPELTMAYDFSKLKNMGKKKRKKFLEACSKLLEAAAADVTGLIRAENGLQSNGGDPDKDKDTPTVLDYLLKKAETWRRESTRVTLREQVDKLRKEGKNDEQIIKAFKASKYYTNIIAEIEADLKEGKDPLKRPKPQQKKKPNPKPNPKPKSDDEDEDEDGDGPDTSAYEADAFHRTPEEWATYLYMENDFRKSVKKGFFNDLKPDGTNGVPKISIFEMAAYYTSKGVEVPGFVAKEIKEEIIRIEEKRAAAGA